MRIGLVFAGGGGKGAYQIGVWKALRTLGIDREIDAVSGTSVGALNAALFTQGDLTKAISVWEHISPDQILTDGSIASLQTSALALKDGRQLEGVFTLNGLRALLDAALDSGQISRSRTACYVTCCHLPDFVPYRFPLTGSRDRMMRILMASSALPAIFPPVSIDGQLYCDGGSPGGDNVPVAPLYQLGCRQIIVVVLSTSSPVDLTWQQQYPDASFLILRPSQSLGSFVDGTLDFDAEHARARMSLGEQDALSLFGRPVHWQSVSEILGESFVRGAEQLIRFLDNL